jgi:hypothetical protein
MSEYLKVLGGVFLAAAFCQVMVSQPWLSLEGGSEELYDQASWSMHGTAFQKGLATTLDGIVIHKRCMEDVNTPGHDSTGAFGTDLPEARIYMACYTEELKNSASRFCDGPMKKNYLWNVAHYAQSFKRASDNYKAMVEAQNHPKESTSPTPREVELEIQQQIEDLVHRTGPYEPDGIETAIDDPPRFEPAILDSLNGFVRLGVLDPKTDLAPVIDISLLSAKPGAAEAAAARKRICK